MDSPAQWTRRIVPGLLAASLVVGATGTVAALAPSGFATRPAVDALSPADASSTHPSRATASRPDVGNPVSREMLAATRDRASVAGPVPELIARPRARVEPAVKAAARQPSQPAYRGRNHIWIPSLGVSRDLTWFPCSRTTPPGHRLYRWGCAGQNNVYVFAHASSVFRQLHDAYVSRRLRKGMRVIHADGNGRVRAYRVRFWKVVSPVGADWAYAAQPRPSMTLQTCVGARSQYRLVVRLTLA